MASADQLNELVNSLDPSQLFSGFWNSMPPEYTNRFELMLDLGVGLLIAGLVYLAILVLIKLFTGFFGVRKLKKISKQLDEIIYLLSKDKGKLSKEKEQKEEKKNKKADRKL